MKKKDFDDLLLSVKQAGDIRQGKLKPTRVFQFDPLKIKDVRMKLKKSQMEFAYMIGVSPHTLRNWEQGRRKPDGPALALLKVAAKNPKAVLEALQT